MTDTPSTMPATPWQPVVAALANEHALRVYAAHVLGLPGTAPDATTAAADAKALRRLAAVGLLDAGT